MSKSGETGAAAHAYQIIKQKILDLTLLPGEFVSERGLAADLGVSRTPLREAMFRLESERLLQRSSRGGMRVPFVTARDVQDIYLCRLELDVLAARLVIERASDAEIDELAEQLKIAGKASKAGRRTEMAASVDAFHETLHRLSQNEWLTAAAEPLHAHVHRIEVLSARRVEQALFPAHLATLVDALRGRDPETAEAALRSHVAANLGATQRHVRTVMDAGGLDKVPTGPRARPRRRSTEST